MKPLTLTFGEISTLCLELSLFLHAGADSSGALVLLAEDCEDKALKEQFLQMSSHMDEGLSLSSAMEQSQLFPKEVWTMLRVGEESGRSEEALTALHHYYEQRDHMEQQLRSALLYPSILMLVMLVVIVVLLTQVLPIFNDVYASLGGQMTGLAAGLLQLGQLINTVLPLILLLLIAAAVGILAVSTVESLRKRFFSLFHGRQSAAMNRARFAQALSMALSSGMPPEDALDSAALLLDDGLDSIEVCRQNLQQGVSFAEALQKAKLLPAAECRLLALGFASGSGENAATEIARRMMQAAEDALERRMSLIEPIMVVSASILVGMILLTVMLPLTRIMSAIG